MGRAANRAVTEICDNDKVVAAHVAFRTRVAERGASRFLPGSTPPSDRPPGARGAGSRRPGRFGRRCPSLLKALSEQSVRPAGAVVVCTGPDDGSAGPPYGAEVVVLRENADGGNGAWNDGFSALRSSEIGSGCSWTGWNARAEPPRARRRFFRAGPTSASSCRGRFAPADAPPSRRPRAPTCRISSSSNDVTPASAFRAEALGEQPPFAATMPREYGLWRVANTVLSQGWAAVTLPSRSRCGTRSEARSSGPTRPRFAPSAARFWTDSPERFPGRRSTSSRVRPVAESDGRCSAAPAPLATVPRCDRPSPEGRRGAARAGPAIATTFGQTSNPPVAVLRFVRIMRNVG